jgi:hypothetical protein
MHLCSGTARCLRFCWASVKGTVTVVVTLATIISGIAAAVAAYYARETTRVVFEVEVERLSYEKNKYSSDMYQRYVDFIKTTAPVTPCLGAVKKLSGGEFRTLWKSPNEFDFQAKSATHVGLAQCLQVESDRRRYRDTPEDWTREQSNAVRGTIVIWLNQLDAYLLLFQHDIGNKGILCENIIGDVRDDDSPFKELLVRMNEEKFLGPVANIRKFLEEYGSGSKKCPPTRPDKRIPEPLPEHILRRAGELLGPWLPHGGKEAAGN